MKTLEDALSVAVEIPHGRYRLARDPYALISNEGGCARLDGYYEPSELRRIADHLDPQPDSAPVIPEGYALVPNEFDDWPEYHPEGMGCGLEDRGIHDRYEAMRYGWEQAIEQLGERINGHLEADHATPFRTEAEVRAEALKDWRKFCEILGVDPSLSMGQVAAHVHGKVANIRAEARREALEEAVKVCDALQRKHDAAFDGVVDRARAGVTDLELAGAAAAAGMETSARGAAAAIRALIEKERADGE